MASIIRIKRSGTSGDPSTLGQGELAYSYLADNGSNGGDRLYIGTGTEIAGNAVNHEVIGGKFFTQMLDHAKGTLTPNSAIIVDADSKIDQLIVDDITLDGSTIGVTGSLTLDLQGNNLDVGGGNVENVANPTADDHAVNKSYADALASFFSVTVGTDDGTFSYLPASEFVTYAGGTGLTSVKDSDAHIVTYNLDDTSVTAGSYGSTTQIPTFTVDDQGRLTAASQVSVATNLTVNQNAISLLDSDLTFSATGNGLTLTIDSDTNVVDYAIADATASQKGVASFRDSDFSIVSGHISLADQIPEQFTTDSGTAIPTGHNLNILGSAIQGLDVTASGSTVTVTPRTATYTQLGTAKFAATDFQLNTGEVSIDSDFIRQITTDDGQVPITGHAVSILGGEGINVTHSGTNISVAGEEATANNLGVASFQDTDFDISNGHISLKAGSVANADLVNDSLTIGDTEVELGATITDLTGLTGATVDNIRIDGNKISTDTSTEVLVLDPKSGDSNGGQVLVLGDLVVQGTQTIINSTTMSVNDLNLVLADSAADATAANGAGITINGADATFTYTVAGDQFNSNKNLDVPNLLINGTEINEHIEDHLGNNFFAVGEGLDITYGSSQDSDNTIIFSAELATVSNNGVASFDSDQFGVTSGLVTVESLDGGTY